MKLLNISAVIAAVALLGVASAIPILPPKTSTVNRYPFGNINSRSFNPTPAFQAEPANPNLDEFMAWIEPISAGENDNSMLVTQWIKPNNMWQLWHGIRIGTGIFDPTPIHAKEQRSLDPILENIKPGTLYVEEQNVRQIFHTFCHFLQDPDEEVREQGRSIADSARRIVLTACKEFQNPGNEKVDAQFIGAVLGGLSAFNSAFGTLGKFSVNIHTPMPSTFPLTKEQDLQQWLDRSKQFLSYLCDFIQAPNDENKVTEEFSVPQSAKRITLSVCKEVQDPGYGKANTHFLQGINKINRIRNMIGSSQVQERSSGPFVLYPRNEKLANVDQFSLNKLSNLKLVNNYKTGADKVFVRTGNAQFDFSNSANNIDTDKQDKSEEFLNTIGGFVPGSHERSKQVLQELEDLSQ